MRAAARDVVTGEPLRKDTRYVIRVRDEGVRVDWQPSQEDFEDGFEPEVSVVPTRMHTQQPSPDGLAGAKRWSPEFGRYIGPLRPRSVEDADRELDEWWRIPYALDRVLRGFVERYGGSEERGRRACDAALAILREHTSYAAVAEAFDTDMWWVRVQVGLAYRFAHRRNTSSARQG